MTIDEAFETLKENICSMCPYTSKGMEVCDIRSCDNRNAIKALEREFCEDSVSREAVLAMSDYVGETPTYSNPYAKSEEVVRVKDIMALPPVQPQTKTGHWIKVPYEQTFFCSECNCRLDDEQTYVPLNYCPNCGCRMVEPHESEE